MPEAPYLSIVVTTRNDDHGGSLLRRTQTFLNALLGQIRRPGLSCELIIVEWNPPEDRPRLRDALRWPAGMPPDRVRIIEVPRSIHARYRNAEDLPLYQMIAKNAGIRRARGEFILATNIDILFSDELMAFIAARQLDSACLYRIDRHDVMTDVPVDAPVEDQLAYCKSHLLRINSRAGSFPLTPEGFPALAPNDIADTDAGIVFGEGWFPPELEGSRPFRWVANDAEMAILPPAAGPRTLLFEIAPGPSMGSTVFDLEFVAVDGRTLAQVQIEGRSLITVQLPPTGDRFRFRLHTPQGGLPIPRNPRTLNFRVLRCEWQKPAPLHLPPAPSPAAPGAGQVPDVEERPGEETVSQNTSGEELFSGFRSDSHPIGRFRRISGFAGKIAGILRRAAENGPVLTVWVPVPRLARRFLRFCFRLPHENNLAGQLAAVQQGSTQPIEALPPADPDPEPERVPAVEAPDPQPSLIPEPVVEPASPVDVPASAPPGFSDSSPVYLHTNGCGDFTLMHRCHWFALRGYAEWELYSFHIDSVLCYAAYHSGLREVVLPEPMRIYHIEHGRGSGWSPEGEQQLFERLRSKGIAWLEYGEVITWACQMRRLACPMIFNLENWGLSDDQLPELPPPGSVFPAPLEYADVRTALAEARSLARARPLEPYPGWHFGAWEEDMDPFVERRRAVWSYFNRRRLDTPLEFEWYCGLRLTLYMGNDPSRELFVGGCIDPNEFAFLERFLRPGMVVIDAGANEGLYSLFAAQRVGDTGRVLAFEPSARERARLKANIQLNRLQKNITVYGIGLGDEDRQAVLQIAEPEHAGHNTFGAFIYPGTRLCRSEHATVRSLDAVFREARLERLDFLKMDVEGGEAKLVQGAREVIARHRPVLLFEVSDAALRNQASNRDELFQAIASLDYSFYGFDPNTGLPVPISGNESEGCNVIAVPSGIAIETLIPQR